MPSHLNTPQAEEDAAAQRVAAQHHLRGGGAGQARLMSMVENAAAQADAYEGELAQALALSIMPMEQLQAAAREACAVSAAMGEEPPLGEEDALAQELLVWFKRNFFQWVNAPPCAACGCSATVGAGTVAPSPEEAEHRAGRTELYRCPQCAAVTRFPRYNDPAKLLETRRGRCGEWANCFTLCCRAAGLEARLAVDASDHVWTEAWSPALRRWVHLDPCEAACDKPLLYEAGWGKQLTYVIAVGRHGAADVTRRYSQAWADTLKRRGMVGEAWLEAYLQQATARRRAPLPAQQRAELEQRDAADRRDLQARGGGQLHAEDLALPGRTTGDAAWLAQRGEDGSAGVGRRLQGAAAAAVPPPGTRYRLARDEGLRAEQPQRVCGGAVRASGENTPSETAACALDGNQGTKWLDFGGPKGNAWLEYRLPADQPAAALHSYALTSANDSPERDPCHVVLEAWPDGAADWVVLDERRDLRFPARHHRLLLHIGGGAAAPVPAARRFRLRVVRVGNPSAANSVQLACLDLYAAQQQQEQARQQGAHEEAVAPENPWAELFGGQQT